MGTASAETAQLFSSGRALLEAGDAAQSLACFRTALTLVSDNPVLWLYAGAALHDLKRYDEAILSYRRATQISPDMGEAHNNLGNSLMALGRFCEAAESFSRASVLLPSTAVPLAARATALQAMGEIEEAETECRKALRLDPSFAAAHWNLALNLLLQGRFAEGWPEYEWRWRKHDFTSPVRHADIPLWDGTPLSGRSILLHAEQGFGDTIQFVRYASLVAQCGGRVILECHPELVPLLQSVDGVQATVPFGAAQAPFDFQAPLLSLPRIFGTVLQSVPARCPYLTVAPEYRKKWAGLLPAQHGTFRVGLVWAGNSIHHNDMFRSMPVNCFEALAHSRKNVTLFSLQLGDAKRQLATSGFVGEVVDLTEQIGDFADTAALVQQLHLIISIDSSVAHLAGALGKPVFLLLPFAPDWRWLLGRSDSPWYPAMRIFRQQRPGGWDEMMERVRNEVVILESTQ